MRYRFDAEGVHMRWGLLFRREVNLTYTRIQDIHLRSGPFQRWLKIADVQVQTAAGSATAEMTIEGLLEFEAVRDFLYARMRGHASHEPTGDGRGDLADVLGEVARELVKVRESLERLAVRSQG
jgi:putative membrane protein